MGMGVINFKVIEMYIKHPIGCFMLNDVSKKKDQNGGVKRLTGGRRRCRRK